jgi:hypothetical protein
MPIIFNTRADIDALPAAEKPQAMALLAGTLWRLEKDDAAQCWRAVEDNAGITRFGFTRADFPAAQPPALPAYVPPAPVPAPRFTSLEFLALFTDAEQLAVATAAMQSAPVKLWYDKVLAASFVTLDDPRTAAGLSDLVAAGLLTAERKAEIVEAMA